MKLTRRELAAAALAAPLASAQTASPQAAPATPEEEFGAARKRLAAAQAAIDKVDLPMAVEPSAVFRA